jgi:phosphoribosyl-dephospho-CoA transferase
MEERLNVDIALLGESPQAVLAILEEMDAENVEQINERGMTGIETVIVCSIIASVLANLIMRLVPLWKCGVIVDARGARVLTKKEPDLPPGTVLVIARNGVRSTLHKPSQVEIDSLLKRTE